MVAARRPSHHWLPFTQMAEFDLTARSFVRGRDTTLWDASGHAVFDAISSVWTTVHGHGRPEIVRAIARQARKLDHATALGATNPVAEELAERLCARSGLARAFFSSDGASAVEVALKMAVQYWQNAGVPGRTRFVHLREAYHGDTVAGMSVSDIAAFKARFSPLLFETLTFEDLHAAVRRDDVAAIVVEPLVQAAAGMRTVPAERYAPLLEARRDGPLLVVDEIATGFGRTGTLFAFEQLRLQPDLVTLGKGLTGGTLALSAPLASERVYESFLGSYADGRHLLHGHSYAANPIACAAALASLAIFERDDTLGHVARLGAGLDQILARVGGHPLVRTIRRAGLMVGIELATERIEARDAPTPGWRVANALYLRGHFTRPIGPVIQLVPPLITVPAEVDAFAGALWAVLDAAA